jgi:hypothetical protein
VWSSSIEVDWYTARFFATFINEPGLDDARTLLIEEAACAESSAHATATPVASIRKVRRDNLSLIGPELF